ncbi:ribonuclease 2-like [Ipomoea triloba]|uniref:ribonuclease 2-like n=1 Tax=Ipomoea triloba TaxID=35885 RepID=UPI00125D7A31|nr:ribonuclease 2-like [Ipomoea triloba]
MASLPAKAKLILPLLLLLGVATAAPLNKAKKEFDYFTLALTWSGTKCLNARECCSSNGCCNPDVGSKFTIRGLWPEYNDGTWPTCCNGTAFDQDGVDIQLLMPDLARDWPSYYCTLSSACGSPKGSNWAYEWVKRGTCASPVLTTIYGYFSKALELSSSFDVTGILSESGYVASDSAKYLVGGIIQAIEKELGVTPILSCYGDAVKEVQLCFDKNLQIQECPTIESGMLSKSDECPGFVRLPIKTAPEKMNYLSLRGVQNW